MATDLAPGNILQRMHFRRRVRAWKAEYSRPLHFVELGAGTGWLSEVALEEGCSGVAFDLNPHCCAAAEKRNLAAIDEGRYRVRNAPFTVDEASAVGPTDWVVSCMVLEHLTDAEIGEVVAAARAAWRPDGGIFAAFVPAGLRYWGIEDEIAGHLRRYDPPSLRELSRRHDLDLIHTAGLTFPLSNLLRTLSDRLVAREESKKKALSLQERTVASGFREVPFKTRFPPWAGLILNEWALWPFDVLQRIFSRSPRSMVLYAEWTGPNQPSFA